MMRERIEKGIGRRVVALGRVAEDARDGREHDEAIEVEAERSFVQEPRAMRFGREHFLHALARERGERRVVDHHREMEHALERMPGG